MADSENTATAARARPRRTTMDMDAFLASLQSDTGQPCDLGGAPARLYERDGRLVAVFEEAGRAPLDGVQAVAAIAGGDLRLVTEETYSAWLLMHPDHTPTEAPIKEVTIPACDKHLGRYKKTVRLRWRCPVCGGPRGEVVRRHSYDGSRRMICDGWDNPCGHVDKYRDVREEARRDGLNDAPHKNAEVPE